MANQRILLWGMLALVFWLTWEAWQKDYAPRPLPPAPAATASAPASGAPTPATHTALGDTVPGLPAAATPTPAGQPAAPNGGAQQVLSADLANEAGNIHVVTDVLDMDIGLQGGTFKSAELLQYPVHKKQPNVRVRLFNTRAGEPPYVFQSGLTSGEATQPDHRALFTSPASEYRLAEGQNELRVPLQWTNSNGVTVTKTYVFKRGSYAIDVQYAVNNQGAAEWRASSYLRFLRHYEHVERSMWDVDTYSFRGPAVYDGTKYKKLKIEDDEDKKYAAKVQNGWLASLQHHFVAAAVPSADKQYEYKVQVDGNDYLLSALGPAQVVAPGAQLQFNEKVFVGPKLQSQLEKTGPELQLTTDYGILALISRPLFQVLEWIHKGVGNWGLAIILVTLLIKLVFYPLSEASGRSMAKMRLLAPRIKNLQERYKDNREQLGRAMMDIYKKEKINPVSGCLPMLIQIPVFIAFYWMLLESVEMRQAPFMLWIDDLSSKDPFFVLPILMGAAMFAQFKLNPAPPDPIQAKVFMFMPLVMTVMFAFFPSGLVLYWLTNTLLSILQQWNINRRIETAKKV